MIRSHLFIFVFVVNTLGGGSEKMFQLFMSESGLFSSRSLIVSGLMSRSFIHFEFIFVYGVRGYSNVILLHVAVQFCNFFLLSFCHFWGRSHGLWEVPRLGV